MSGQSLAWCPAPVLTASSAPPRLPCPATGSLHHATQEHGTPPKPHPVTRAHGRRQREKVTGRQEVGQRQREQLRWGKIHERAGSLESLIILCKSSVRRAEEGRRGNAALVSVMVQMKWAVLRQRLGNSEWSNFSAGLSFSTCHDYSGW